MLLWSLCGQPHSARPALSVYSLLVVTMPHANSKCNTIYMLLGLEAPAINQNVFTRHVTDDNTDLCNLNVDAKPLMMQPSLSSLPFILLFRSTLCQSLMPFCM